MLMVEPLQPQRLPQAQALINAHLSALAPGWSIPEAFITSRIHHDPGEYIVGPWVIERATLCAFERRRVVAVAHLLRYGAGPEINPAYHNLGEIDWVFAWPDAKEATEALFAAADRQFAAWGVREAWVHGGTLVGPFVGIPDVWPHIALFLRAAGYEPAEDQDEMIYGGRIEHIALPGESPIPGLTLQRASGLLGTRFTVWLEDQRIGHCECVLDLTEGDALPALRGWAELAEIEIEPQCRRRGIGTWLVQHAVEWLRFGRCDRIILAVSAEAEASGADRFYQRFGWSRLARQTKQWKRKAQRQT